MQPDELAVQLLDIAARDGQVARRIRSGNDTAAVRSCIRALARTRQVRIRTAEMDDVLLVVLADAPIWDEPAAVMKTKLTPID